MPYIATRRLYGIAVKKVSRFFVCNKSKKNFNEMARFSTDHKSSKSKMQNL